MAENAKEQPVLVAPAESPDGRPRFYGYHVAHRGGEVVVLGAGVYEVEGDKQRATLVKGVSALSDKELEELAINTPPELLPHLDKSGLRRVVDTRIRVLLKKDPLAIFEEPREILTSERVEYILSVAQEEQHPVMFDFLLQKLMGIISQKKGYDAGVVSIILARKQDEIREDELLQKPAEEARKMEEERRRREEEERRRRRERGREQALIELPKIHSWIVAFVSVTGSVVAGSQKSRARQLATVAA